MRIRSTVYVVSAIVVTLSGCVPAMKGTANLSQETPGYVPSAPDSVASTLAPLPTEKYVSLEYPISLPSIIASGLNLDESKKNLGFNRTLLALSSSATKVSTSQIDAKGSITVLSGVAKGATNKTRFRTTYDTVIFASYPLKLQVPYDVPRGCLQHNKSMCQTGTINILPIIGSGVRVNAIYDSIDGSAALSLGYFSGDASASSMNGSLELQMLGVSRFGSSAAGISNLDLTPKTAAIMLQQVNSIMSQLWYKDTVIQPQIVGYTLLGYPDPELANTAVIMDVLLDNVDEVARQFFETLLSESIRRGDVNDPLEIDRLRKEFGDRLTESRFYSRRNPITDIVIARVNTRLRSDKIDDLTLQLLILNSVLRKQPGSADRLDTTALENSIIKERDRLCGVHSKIIACVSNNISAVPDEAARTKVKQLAVNALLKTCAEKEVAEIQNDDLEEQTQDAIRRVAHDLSLKLNAFPAKVATPAAVTPAAVTPPAAAALAVPSP